jgi:hypothetical protein
MRLRFLHKKGKGDVRLGNGSYKVLHEPVHSPRLIVDAFSSRNNSDVAFFFGLHIIFKSVEEVKYGRAGAVVQLGQRFRSRDIDGE